MSPKRKEDADRLKLASRARELEERVKELEAANRGTEPSAQAALIQRMASVIGHEVRNPLAVINNSVYFVRTKLGAGPALDPKVAKHIGIIESEVKNANAIIERILVYSRAVELNAEPHAVDAIIEEVLEEVKLPAGVSARKDLAAGLRAEVDAPLFKRAVRALVDNAVEATAPGGAFTVSAKAEGSSLLVEVSDSGPGISADMAPRLFEPFTTNKPRGIGLGLALARKAAERHGGKVGGENRPGGGAVFRMTLPLKQSGSA